LVGDIVVEVVASDVDDDLARSTLPVRLTLHAHCALLQIGANLARTGGRVVHQLGIDGGHVSIDECNAALNFGIGETVLGQIATLHVQLSLERALVGEVVVEVALGDSDQDFTCAASVMWWRAAGLTFFAIRPR